MITHGGLIHNVKLMRSKFKSTSGTILVSWLPQYHDMGLIGGLLTAMVSGATAVLYSPSTFIKNPMLWLETMSKYNATHSAAPNFAFELIVRRFEALQASGIDTGFIDLRSIQFIMSSAEPIRHSTLRRLLELLQGNGLRERSIAPGYGLAENCVLVSCAYGKGKPIILDWENRVCCGYIEKGNRDVDVCIVNPKTFEELPDGTEGEVWVSSPSAGAGYWGEIELTTTTFKNQIKDARPPGNDHGEFFRTGDLGRVKEGLLFITGRIKDLIIIRGRNIYPADVEKTVETFCQNLRPGCSAAFCVPSKLLQQRGVSVEALEEEVGLVILAEVKDPLKVDHKDLASLIKSAIASEHGIVGATVCLIKPRTLPKTTSGKICRFECLHQFTNEKLQILNPKKAFQSFRPADLEKPTGCNKKTFQDFDSKKHCICRIPNLNLTKDSITKFLIDMICEKAGIPKNEISTEDKIDLYGVDSLGVVWIAQKLSNFVGKHVSAIDIYTASCISEIVDCLGKENPHFDAEQECFCEQTAGTSKKPKLGFIDAILVESDLESAYNPSFSRTVAITVLQVISILCMALLLISLATFPVNRLTWLIYKSEHTCLILLTIGLVPITFMVYIILVGLALSLLGKTIGVPKYSLQTCIPFWSVDFVRWWTRYRLQDFASNMFAVHLRGTIFITWWYRALGAYIGHGVNLDTTDITDPSLVIILDGASIGDGVTLQSHEIKDSCVWLQPIKIGKKALLEPFSFISNGTVLKDGITVAALGKGPATKAQVAVSPTDQIENIEERHSSMLPVLQLLGFYVVGLASTISASLSAVYFRWCIINLGIIPKDPDLLHAYYTSKAEYVIFPLAAVFPWALAGVLPLACCQDPKMSFQILKGILVEGKVITFVGCIGGAYVSFGILLWAITCSMKRILIGKFEATNVIRPTSSLGFRVWLVQRLITFLHYKCTIFLAGTDMMCTYLRSMGAKIGHAASIRRINPIIDPDMVDVGDRCHLGDHANIITCSKHLGTSSPSLGKVTIGRDCVIGAHSVLMPKSTLEDEAWLAAMSVAPFGSILEKGGVYLGVETLAQARNHSSNHSSILTRFPGLKRDIISIADIDHSYLQDIIQVAEHFFKTSSSLKMRSLHRAGIGAKGTMKIMEDLRELPKHDIIFPGKIFPVIVRHSNGFSSKDDACPDVRGAGLRIFASEGKETLLDLILKTGQAFYVRSLLDQNKWFEYDQNKKEEIVKKFPHIGKAIWESLRDTDSYTKLHYYSNVCCLLRPTIQAQDQPIGTTQEYYVKFKLRPVEQGYEESYGEVKAEETLPNGFLPRRAGDMRSPTCLTDDFKERISSPGGICYVLQMQIQPIPDSSAERDSVLDCTKPWDAQDFPYTDVASIHLNELLADDVTEALRLNHKNSTRSLGLVPAQKASDSASIDHARSLIYEMVQHLRGDVQVLPTREMNKNTRSKPALELESNGNCAAMHAPLPHPNSTVAACSLDNNHAKGAHLTMNSQMLVSSSSIKATKTRFLALFLAGLVALQPLLQILLPVTLLALASYPSSLALTYTGSKMGTHWMLMLIPCGFLISGCLFSLLTILSKWIMVGRTKESVLEGLRGFKAFQETTWQAINTLLSSYFLDLTRGSAMCPFYFRCLGASMERNVYMDTLFALNPDGLKVREGAMIGRNALLFGHVYEGKHVIFKGNEIGARACMGGRALALPGVRMEDGSRMAALSLGMKDELIIAPLLPPLRSHPIIKIQNKNKNKTR